jgi:hypothetical protein
MSLDVLLERLGGDWISEEEEQELLDSSFEDDYQAYLEGKEDD